MRSRRRGLPSAILIGVMTCGVALSAVPARAERELTAARVKESIRAAQQFLIRAQNPEGS